MIVTVFRSRLRDGLRDDYMALVERMVEIATKMPGYISHKGFFAEDGERCTIVEFESEETQRAWRMNAEHRNRRAVGQRDDRVAVGIDAHVRIAGLVQRIVGRLVDLPRLPPARSQMKHVGVDLVVRGVPVMVAANPKYSGLGIVEEPSSAHHISWGPENQPLAVEKFDLIYYRLLAFLQGKEICGVPRVAEHIG